MQGTSKGLVAVLIILVFGAAGYLFYSMKYKPAVEARTSAKTALDAAVQDVETAKSELRTAEENLKAETQKNVPPRDAVAKTTLSRTAVPPDTNIGDAAVYIEKLAERSGVQILLELGGDAAGQQATTAGTTGATPIDIPIEGAGTYAQMITFMDQVESTVFDRGGKAYVNGRLFNVVAFEVSPPSDEGGGGDSAGAFDVESSVLLNNTATEADNLNGLKFDDGDIAFTLTIRMYTSSADQAESVGASTPDSAAQGQPADQTAVDGSQPTTGADAAGGAPGAGDPAAGGAPSGSDPSAAGTADTTATTAGAA